MTWADVPSGATSVSRTTAVATGAETARWRTTSGHAEDLERGLERLGGVGRAERLVGSEVAGQAVRRAAGAPRQGGARPDRRPVGVAVDAGRRRACSAAVAERPADERQRPTAEPPLGRLGRRMRIRRRRPPAPRPAPPGTARARRTRARTRRPPVRSSAPFGIPFSQRSKKRTSSWRSSRFGPGVADDGRSWTQLPTIVRDGAVQAACIRSAASTYESIQPPTLRIAASIAS